MGELGSGEKYSDMLEPVSIMLGTKNYDEYLFENAKKFWWIEYRGPRE